MGIIIIIVVKLLKCCGGPTCSSTKTTGGMNAFDLKIESLVDHFFCHSFPGYLFSFWFADKGKIPIGKKHQRTSKKKEKKQ